MNTKRLAPIIFHISLKRRKTQNHIWGRKGKKIKRGKNLFLKFHYFGHSKFFHKERYKNSHLFLCIFPFILTNFYSPAKGTLEKIMVKMINFVIVNFWFGRTWKLSTLPPKRQHGVPLAKLITPKKKIKYSIYKYAFWGLLAYIWLKYWWQFLVKGSALSLSFIHFFNSNPYSVIVRRPSLPLLTSGKKIKINVQ